MHSQLNIGVIGKAELRSWAGAGDVARVVEVAGITSSLCRTRELNTGLKAVASGLKDVVRCCNIDMGRSMLSMLLLLGR
jgi:hypothetical protein